ncbi:uncharacterized protein LOC116173337 isoform X2 [Photinus pyralis]|uniref:uncharacterized protein LOC116173337 isoform X2 n=1 Tax=Photinus pyralis TaxID=7054 RepID=UPI0012674E60|nr:uncharacterized protein LOC116173337 isoform X2 [Photinus pyralis]
MDILFLCLIFGLLGSSGADLNGNCELEEVTAGYWSTEYTNQKVNDDETKEFKRFKATNVEGVKISTVNNYKYFSVQLEDNAVIISPSAEFKNIEINENSNRQFKIIASLIFSCTNGSGVLAFYQPINDLNTYTPEFQQSSYSYRLPMPLPANFDMSCLFDVPIVVCDQDITNTQVTFAITPSEDFSIIWQGATDTSNKCHRAVVKTAKPLSLTELKDYVLSATDIGTPTKRSEAQLRIEVNQEQSIPKNPQFKLAYYTARYNDEKDTHSVTFDTDITLNLNDYVTTYSLEGEHKQHFDLQSTSNGVAVTLKTNLPDEVLNENAIVLLTLEAKIDKAEDTGRTVLVVYLPKKVTTTPAPTTCPETVTPTECPVCTTEPSVSTTIAVCPTCKPCSTECPPCSTTENPECPTCAPCTACPTTERPAVSSTTSTDPESSSTERPATSSPRPPSPSTTYQTSTESLVTSEWSTSPDPECPIITCEPCTVCPTTERPAVSSTTSTYPESSSTERPATSSPRPPSSSTTYQTSLVTSESSTSPGPECPTTCKPCTECPVTGWSTLPGPECPTTCGTPTECPPCSTTPNPPTPTISFEQKTYVFTIPPIASITVGVVRANSNTQEAVKYTMHPLEGSTIPTQLKLSESSGRLTVEEKLTIGTYKFQIKAEGVVSKVGDVTDVVINVVTEAATMYSVIVKEIDELSEAVITLPCEKTTSTCAYEFDYQYPETNPPLFTVENGHLKSSSINLQMDQIKNLLVPQFTVNLKLRQKAPTLRNLTSVRALNVKAEESRQWVLLPTQLRRESDSLLVSVIINDINNNPPVFKEGTNLVVGYPVQKLVHELHPPYLVQVKATDLDRRPLNAEIRYSTNSPNFIVHPLSGTIYPGKSALVDDKPVTFEVIAKDRAGGDNSLSAILRIQVVPLSKGQLTLLNVPGMVLEDIDEVISSLSDKSKMKIRYLKTTTVYPPFDAGRSILNLLTFGATKSESDHSLSIVIYAFDSNNEVIPTEKVQSNLSGMENIVVESWIPSADSEPVNNTGFIAAIAVLSVLVVVLLIGIGLLYFFKIRKISKGGAPYRNLSHIDTVTKKSVEDENPSEVLPKARSTGFGFNSQPPEDDSYSNEHNGYFDFLDSERSSVQPSVKSNENKLDNVVPQPDLQRGVDSLSAQLLKKINERAREDTPSETDVDELKDQKKSVSFKPTVQKINIVVDEEKNDNDIGNKL